jgi:hypothetical protein
MIIIAGDSWGYGEWSDSDPHVGLPQYLTNDGHTVVNLSKAGGSNYEAWYRLDNFLIANDYHVKNIEKIFVFQTEWDRDLTMHDYPILDRIDNPSDIFKAIGFVWVDSNKNIEEQIDLRTANSLGTVMLDNFYQQLSRIATKHGLTIELLGGCCDVAESDFGNRYPGLRVACQSVTNFLITDNPDTDRPITTLYQRQPAVNFIKKHLHNNYELEMLLDSIDYNQTRFATWFNNKPWFYPDGGHANRQGHRKLYNFLRQNW